MPRIAGVNLPENKRVDVGLTSIYGLGRRNIVKILKEAAVDRDKIVVDLTTEEVTRLTKIIEQLPVEGVLRQQINENIKRLKSIGAYRGVRHSQSLPVRGQRTRSNARTKRGKRKTIGALRKKDISRVETTQKTQSEEA